MSKKHIILYTLCLTLALVYYWLQTGYLNIDPKHYHASKEFFGQDTQYVYTDNLYVSIMLILIAAITYTANEIDKDNQ